MLSSKEEVEVQWPSLSEGGGGAEGRYHQRGSGGTVALSLEPLARALCQNPCLANQWW